MTSSSWCLFCYKNFHPNILSDNDNDSVEKRFFKLLERYLSSEAGLEGAGETVKLEALLTLVLSTDGGRLIRCCYECGILLCSFCEAYHRMKVAEMEVEWRLRRLTTVMTKADRMSCRVKKMKGVLRNSVNQEEGKRWSELSLMRGTLRQKCRRKLRRTFPRVLLTRCGLTGLESETKMGCHNAIAETTTNLSATTKATCDITDADSSKKYSDPEVGSHQNYRRLKMDAANIRRRIHKQLPCSVCGKLLPSLKSLKRHLQIHSVDRPLKCPDCGLGFRDWSTRRIHEFRAHPERVLANYKVPETNLEDFKNVLRLLLRKLVIAKDGGKSHECQCCGRRFAHRADCEQHIVSQHNDRFSQDIRALQNDPRTLSPQSEDVADSLQNGVARLCHICSKVLGSQSSLARHLEGHAGTLPYKCGFCSLSFRQQISATRHEYRGHRAQIFGKVKDSGVSPGKFTEAVNSVLKHFVDKNRCTLCDRKHARTNLCEQHVMQRHSQRFCAELKSYQQKFLEVPVDVEAPSVNRRYKCEYCSLRFHDTSNRRSHAFRAHLEEVLVNYRAPETKNDADFLGAIKQVLKSLVTVGGGKSLCFLCGKKYAHKVDCELHVVQQHKDRFSKDMEAYQKQALSSEPETDRMDLEDETRSEEEDEAEIVPKIEPKIEEEEDKSIFEEETLEDNALTTYSN